jgi:hypothetical protein
MSSEEEHYDKIDEIVLDYISVLLGIISSLACIYIFIYKIYIKFKDRNNLLSNDQQSNDKSSSMILFLTISDFLLALLMITEGMIPLINKQSHLPEDDCVINSSLLTFFCTSSFLWTAAMSHSSYTSVSQLFNNWANPTDNLNSSVAARRKRNSIHVNVKNQQIGIMLKYHLLCWGVPLVLMLIQLFTSISPDEESYSCNIVMTNLPSWFALCIYIIPLFITEMYNISVFRFLAKTLRQIPLGNDLLNKFTR